MTNERNTMADALDESALRAFLQRIHYPVPRRLIQDLSWLLGNSSYNESNTMTLLQHHQAQVVKKAKEDGPLIETMQLDVAEFNRIADSIRAILKMKAIEEQRAEIAKIEAHAKARAEARAKATPQMPAPNATPTLHEMIADVLGTTMATTGVPPHLVSHAAEPPPPQEASAVENHEEDEDEDGDDDGEEDGEEDSDILGEDEETTTFAPEPRPPESPF